MATINGFLVSRYPAKLGAKNFRVPGTQVSLKVRSDVAPLLIGFAAEFNRLVEPLHKGWCWSYRYKRVSGRRRWSFHSAAIAIDLNAPRHPLGKTGTFNAHQVRTIRALCKKYGLRWGGDYRGRKDQMHFEVILQHAQAVALVHRLQSHPSTPPRPRPKVYPIIREGDSGPAVERLQTVLHVHVDGKFGPDTLTALKAAQTAHHLTPDGVAGPLTLKALGW